jgi:hypothetical protein
VTHTVEDSGENVVSTSKDIIISAPPEPLDRMLSIIRSSSYLYGVRGYIGIEDDGIEIYRSNTSTPNIFTKIFEADYPLVKITSVMLNYNSVIAVTGLNGVIYLYIDGITWTNVYENADYIIRDIISISQNNNRLFAIGEPVNPLDNPVCLYSDNSLDWTAVELPVGLNPTVIYNILNWDTYIDEDLVILASDTTSIYMLLSLDQGVTFVKYTLVTGLTNPIATVIPYSYKGYAGAQFSFRTNDGSDYGVYFGELGWWKGENNPNNEIVGGNVLQLRAGVGYDPRYADGIVGRCFRVSKDGDDNPNELTLQYKYETNITDVVPVWEFECWLKADTANTFDILRISDDIGGVDYLTATIYMTDGHIEISNQDTLDDGAVFNSLGITINTWFKLRLSYNNSTGVWRVFINEVEKFSSTYDVVLVNPHQYVNYLCAVQWNSGVVLIDEIKILKGLEVIVGTKLDEGVNDEIVETYYYYH